MFKTNLSALNGKKLWQIGLGLLSAAVVIGGILNLYLYFSSGGTINIARQTMMKSLSDMSFKSEKPLKWNQENYVAKNGIVTVQLLGSTNDLDSAMISVNLAGGSYDDKLKALSLMTNFVNTAGSDCASWFKNTVMGMDLKSGHNISEVACQRKLELNYIPAGKFSLKISAP